VLSGFNLDKIAVIRIGTEIRWRSRQPPPSRLRWTAPVDYCYQQCKLDETESWSSSVARASNTSTPVQFGTVRRFWSYTNATGIPFQGD